MHTTHAFTYAAETLLADAAGVLYWPSRETLVVSDLHLEKGSASAARGYLAPPYDTRETLHCLAQADYGKYDPRQVICLGDSFHDCGADSRMAESDKDILAGLMHRPPPGSGWPATTIPPRPIASADRWSTGWRSGRSFSSTRQSHAHTHEVSGHFHPKASTWVKSTKLSGRCFVIDARAADFAGLWNLYRRSGRS